MHINPSTRERIIDAATTLYIVRGIRATSAQHIADRLGITKPAIFYHFPTLDDLLRAIVMPFLDASGRLIDEFPEVLTTDEELEHYLRSFAALYRENLPAAQVMAFNQQIWTDSMFAGRPAENYRRQLRQLSRGVTDPQRMVRAHIMVQSFFLNIARPAPTFADLELDVDVDDFDDLVVRVALQTLRAA